VCHQFPSNMRPLFFSMMMKPQYTKITGTCNLCSSSRQQQVLDILRFILDRIKKCQPMDNNSNRRRIDIRFLSRSIATSSQWNYHSRNLKCSSSISSRIVRYCPISTSRCSCRSSSGSHCSACSSSHNSACSRSSRHNSA